MPTKSTNQMTIACGKIPKQIHNVPAILIKRHIAMFDVAIGGKDSSRDTSMHDFIFD